MVWYGFVSREYVGYSKDMLVIYRQRKPPYEYTTFIFSVQPPYSSPTTSGFCCALKTLNNFYDNKLFVD